MTFLLAPLAAYVVLVALFALLQDRLVFPAAGRGDRGVPAAHAAGVRSLQRPDGGAFRVVEVHPAAVPAAVAVAFVGNGEDLWRAAEWAAELSAYGLLVVGVEHAGYGGSQGPPGTATILAGAEVAGEHARTLADRLAVPLVAIGSSLGTFCAVHLAAQGKVDRAVLRAPPTSLAAAAKTRFGWLPVDLFLRHRFDNLGKAASVRCPVLVLHGDCDAIVPLGLGRELCAAIGGRAELVVAPGRGHNDLPMARTGALGERLAAFLAGR